MAIKILNPDECKMTSFLFTCGKLYTVKPMFNSEELTVIHARVIDDRTKDVRNGFQASTATMASAVISGFIGLLTVPYRAKVNYDLDIDLYLADGRVIEIWTDDPKFIKFCLPLMHTKDKRERFRKMRGVK